MALQVINGTPKPKTDFTNIYYRMFVKSTKEVYADKTHSNRDALKRLIFSAMKFISSLSKRDEDRESLEEKLIFINTIKHFMSLLTPKEFENIFPIDKHYDGKKREVKDYFYTKEYINGLDEHSLIGEKIDEFLWEYHNIRISLFAVNSLSIISKLNRLETGKSLFEEVFPNMKTYTMHETYGGKKIMVDNETGKTTEVKQPRPRYLKVIN
ncbi:MULTISPECIES: hypothetical protein [unclassified Bacillus (in: firmicutes)]|uniref:hypothetical protein n=1 Tax=unclassified Bacillus (in: firmicutes) TaxID=185979 RepID=UPI000BF4673F|nr:MULTISPECIES: hypothetical protein [unclassified Bacillus (in: firmicutes)]PEU16796.1 hypothetical protein CN524_03450 [Bacillus sp. AFS019443]PEU20318.1 hypothetical protein CN525_04345 [Bacillus sp. AFS014408]